jgi:hypothetical protein
MKVVNNRLLGREVARVVNRWTVGTRRTRVNECYAVLRGEDLYTDLSKDGAVRAMPEDARTAAYTVEGRGHVAGWEVR